MKETDTYFQSKRIEAIDRPLGNLGFKSYKTSYIARITEGQVFQFLYFNKHRFGHQFTIEVCIRPLFCPNEILTLRPGNRLALMETHGATDKWWPSASEAEIDTSMTQVLQIIQQFAIPFFEATQKSQDIIKAHEQNFFGLSMFGKRIQWGTPGYENFDFAHIHLMAGDSNNARKQIAVVQKEIDSGNDQVKILMTKLVNLTTLIDSGRSAIDNYLKQTIFNSKKTLQLESW